MATENRPVTVYMPDEIKTTLAKYCVDQGIVRKDGKPLLSTCILEILKGHLGLNTSSVSILSNVPGSNTLEKMVKELVLETLPVSIPTFDDVVKPSQLDNRVKSINEEFNLKISQLCDRINQLELQLGENMPSPNDLEDVSEIKKGQSQAEQYNTPTKPENTEDDLKPQILEFFENNPNQEYTAAQVKQELNLEMNTQSLGNIIGTIPQIESEKKSGNSKKAKTYKLKQNPVETTTHSDQGESDI